MVRIDLETSLRFAEKNGFLGARQRIWELEEDVEELHRQLGMLDGQCSCDACRNVRSRRKDRD